MIPSPDPTPPETAVLPLARKLGEYFEAIPIPVAEPVETRVLYPTKQHVWPPEVWAEMQAIYKGTTP